MRATKIVSVTFLTMLMFVTSILTVGPQRAFAQDPNCTPDPTGACPTPTDTEIPSSTPTIPSRVTNTPAITFTASMTATLPVLSAPPTSTPTAFGFSLPIPPEENPYRTPQLGLTYPSPTPTKINDAAADIVKKDLEVYAVEVSQGIQDMQNRMPLVQYRRTVLRVYVRTDSGDIYGVRGAVEAYRDGQKLAGGPVFADNQPIAAHQNGGDRLKVEDTLNFTVYQDWRSGKVTYKFFVYPVDPTFPYFYETNAENNFFEITVEYHPGTYATVVMPIIHMHNYDDEGQIFLDQVVDEEFDAIASRDANTLLRYYPITNVEIVGGYGWIRPENHTWDEHIDDWTLISDTGTSDILSEIQAYRDDDNNYSQALWYGMVPSGLPWKWGGLSNGEVAMGVINEVSYEESPGHWYISGGWLAAHEMGHSLGMAHIACGTGEGKPDLFYPYSGDPCSMAAVDPLGYYGFDLYYDIWPQSNGPTVISNDPNAALLNRGFPMMSYRGPKWIDPYTYCKLLPVFGVDCKLADLGISALPSGMKMASLDDLSHIHSEAEFPIHLQNADEYLRVYGLIDIIGNTAKFNDVIRTSQLTEQQIQSVTEHQADIQHEIEEGGTTPYTLTLEDTNGTILSSVPLYNLESVHGPSDAQGFHEVLPFLPGSAFVRVRNDGALIGERAVSANSPTISMTSQNQGGALTAPIDISWEASDADGDSLTYMLQYTSDGGQTWRVLLTDLHTSNVRLDSFAGMAGGSNSYFRVTANDGVNTAQDQNDAAFTIPNSPPSSLIVTPGDNSVFPQGGKITFMGQGMDPEDKGLPGEQLIWTSDLDGGLGSGRELITDTLSPGLHKITLRVTDSAGLSDDTYIFVNVDPNAQIERPSQEERDQVTAIFNGEIPQSPAAPVTTTTDRMTLIVIGLIVLIAFGLIIFGVRKMRRS
jgi:hypothetical protein